MYQPEQPIYDHDVKSNIKVHIKIDEHPKSWWQTVYYALQITLVDFTPFIWAVSFVAIAGLPEAVIPVMITACFIAMGIGTLLQTSIGNRLPIVQGPSASLVSAMGSVTAVYGMPAMWGSVIIGGLMEAFVGAAILGGLSGYIGSMFESVGDYAATCAACDTTFRVKHIDRGIMAEGLGYAVCGVIGALPVTSYTQNIGVVAATGVPSRRVTCGAMINSTASL